MVVEFWQEGVLGMDLGGMKWNLLRESSGDGKLHLIADRVC